ncbi:hypothetical protein V8F20_004479 [Naviculisporaceae sp. PSN 640]
MSARCHRWPLLHTPHTGGLQRVPMHPKHSKSLLQLLEGVSSPAKIGLQCFYGVGSDQSSLLSVESRRLRRGRGCSILSSPVVVACFETQQRCNLCAPSFPQKPTTAMPNMDLAAAWVGMSLRRLSLPSERQGEIAEELNGSSGGIMKVELLVLLHCFRFPPLWQRFWLPMVGPKQARPKHPIPGQIMASYVKWLFPGFNIDLNLKSNKIDKKGKSKATYKYNYIRDLENIVGLIASS